IGFDFHWSFFLDPGGPAGGNAWKDNGDGTFTIANQSPKGLKYSALDLYLMGLADKSEVTPFGVLENVVVPTDFTDPFFKGGYSSQSFPYFGAKPFTVTATKRTLTIDDVVSANGGERAPGVASSQKGFTLGVVLMLDQDSSDADVATAEAALDPVAASLPDAFANATAHRGTMTLVAPADDSDAGTPDLDAGTNGASASPSSSDDGGGCNLASEPSTSAWPIALGGLAVGLAALVRRRRGR
ncbi:MAG: MYXO-CTERM sorting domain-containing protein, partial [Polyangiaceae bacterium]